MKYIAAYLLAKIGGKENPNKEDIKRIIESVGIKIEENHSEEIIEKLKGKDLREIMKEGNSKLSTIPNDNSTQTKKTLSPKENIAYNENTNEEEVDMTIECGFEDLFQ